MKQDNINYTVVGLFVVSISIVMLIVLYLLTGRVSNADRYYTILDDVSGINNGSAISYKGYKIGQLTHIKPVYKDKVTRFELTLSIKSGWVINKGSTIMITKTGLLSDSLLNISEGSSNESLAVRSYLVGKPTNDVMSVVKSLSENINHLSRDSIVPMVKQLKDDVGLFSKTMTNEIPLLTKNLNILIVKLQKNSDVIDTMFSENNSENVKKILQHAGSTVSNLETVSKLLNDLVENNKVKVGASVDEVNATAVLVRNKLDLILNQIEISSHNVNDFSNQIKNNPGVIIRSKSQSDSAIR